MGAREKEKEDDTRRVFHTCKNFNNCCHELELCENTEEQYWQATTSLMCRHSGQRLVYEYRLAIRVKKGTTDRQRCAFYNHLSSYCRIQCGNMYTVSMVQIWRESNEIRKRNLYLSFFCSFLMCSTPFERTHIFRIKSYLALII